ncbi:MAG: 4Fe-4S dicluster domain-containing protein [Colwellia sp.]
MSLSITNECISCNACKLVCPKNAIQLNELRYSITAHRCNECDTHYEHAQCASICPVENAIIDNKGIPLNPSLSLSPEPKVLEFIRAQQSALATQ